MMEEKKLDAKLNELQSDVRALRNEQRALRDELRELRNLVESYLLTPKTPQHADDFVGVEYIIERTGLKRRTILAGLAGTRAITRVSVRPARWNRASVDRFLRNIANQYEKPPKTDVRLVRRRPKSG
jgi:chromosome segregation ATPase